MAENPKAAQDLMDGIMKDLKRAAELGLLPESGGKISKRGEFIVDPSNIEDDENKKMRRYRHLEYPKHLHVVGPDGPIHLEVTSAKDEDAAVAAGWSIEPVTADPSGEGHAVVGASTGTKDAKPAKVTAKK